MSSKRIKVSHKTVKLTVCLTPEVKKKLVDDAYEKFGNHKGAVSVNLEQILRIHYNIKTPGIKET